MATLLLVEDDTLMATLLRLSLERAGHTVTVLHTGTPVLATARAQSPSVILLDMLLPDTDGVAVAQQLKANPETCAIPIVFVTALTDAASVQRAQSSGAQAVLDKPTALTTIARTVTSLLAETYRSADAALTAQ